MNGDRIGFLLPEKRSCLRGQLLERFRVAPLESRFSGMESNSMSDASIAPTADQNVPARFTCRFRCV